ncbi:MAG TPA: hypothetical protein DD381_04265 [Lentisphaeria bacterium]|nr:MAG: hypothetical protein A2X47_07385 [Lentisphaerae bacterium GWF2_38_69]HBM15546.1 hypothetical protein [Lentisphaeria bacterium]
MSPRPFRCRKISAEPKAAYFKPRGIPLCELEEVVLRPDELEALKLADIDDLHQAEAAEKMGISRQTFGNIIGSAHKKIADAILNGKAVCINCDKQEILIERYTCAKCSHTWESVNNDNEPVCPNCKNSELISRESIKNTMAFNPGLCRKARRGKER